MRCRWHHALGASWLGACERALCIVPHHVLYFYVCPFLFFEHIFLDAHTKEQVRDVRLITRCSITNTLRAFVLLGLTARSTKQTAQQYAVPLAPCTWS